ncbi:MAG: carboxymuconolactone decarboxylase family protein [Cyclobacteriaceae bacterium]
MTITKRFSIVEYPDASGQVKAIYDETMKEMGIPFVLNWFKCQGNNPTLLRGNWEKLKSSLLMGDVPFILKQLIIYNISQKKGCNYCAHAHGLMADSMSKTLTDEEGFRVTENMGSDYIPSSYKTAIRIVTEAALNPKAATDEDFEELRDEGFSEQEIQELMGLADLTNMLNTIADISGIKIDNELMETK